MAQHEMYRINAQSIQNQVYNFIPVRGPTKGYNNDNRHKKEIQASVAPPIPTVVSHAHFNPSTTTDPFFKSPHPPSPSTTAFISPRPPASLRIPNTLRDPKSFPPPPPAPPSEQLSLNVPLSPHQSRPPRHPAHPVPAPPPPPPLPPMPPSRKLLQKLMDRLLPRRRRKKKMLRHQQHKQTIKHHIRRL